MIYSYSKHRVNIQHTDFGLDIQNMSYLALDIICSDSKFIFPKSVIVTNNFIIITNYVISLYIWAETQENLSSGFANNKGAD